MEMRQNKKSTDGRQNNKGERGREAGEKFGQMGMATGHRWKRKLKRGEE
jgi:hypothetical protein